LVALLTSVARAVDFQCLHSGTPYRKDLPVIAVTALFEEHCRFGLSFQDKIYGNMAEMGKRRMESLIKLILNAVEDDFPCWSEAIAAPYSHIPPGHLRVYLSPSPEIDIFAVFHMIFQSLRIRHVLPRAWSEIANNFSLRSQRPSSRKR
jgi:hypothetical protein